MTLVVPQIAPKVGAFRWDETAGLAEELGFPQRTRGAKRRPADEEG
jgi:hypothetical protein